MTATERSIQQEAALDSIDSSRVADVLGTSRFIVEHVESHESGDLVRVFNLDAPAGQNLTWISCDLVNA